MWQNRSNATTRYILSSTYIFSLHPICFFIQYASSITRTIFSHGRFDKLRVDNGREFHLSLAIQKISDIQQNQTIRCYQQIESKRVGFGQSKYVNLIRKLWKKKSFQILFIDKLTIKQMITIINKIRKIIIFW